MKLKNTQADTSFDYAMLLKRLYPYIKPLLFRIILGIVVAIPVGLLDGAVSLSLKPYMDYVVGKQNLHIFGMEISYLTLAFLVPFVIIIFAALQGILKYLNFYLSSWSGYKITNAIKKDLFANLIYMDTSFFDENSSGLVLNRYIFDADFSSKGIIEELKCLVVGIFETISLVAVMLYSSALLAVVGVSVLGFTAIPIVLIRKRIKAVSNKNVLINGAMATTLNETYIGNKVVAGYNLQKKQKIKYDKEINNSFCLNMSLVKRVGWMSPVMYLIASFGIAFVLYFGTNLIYTGKMTAGSFAAFVTSLLLLYKPVKNFGNTLTNLQTAFVAMSRVLELFDYVPTIKDKEHTVEMPEVIKEIRFENVCFEYKDNNPVLKNINLTVKQGETVAIVGNSGGGKSTLVNLIPRFYDIKSGAIKFNDTDIRDFKLENLRNMISVVFQENFLFTGTIKENILLANPNASEA